MNEKQNNDERVSADVELRRRLNAAVAHATEGPAGAGTTSEGQSRINRRHWLGVMGASLALAGTTGCRRPEEEILAFSERPAERTPGRTQRFATTMDIAGAAVGLLVTSVDGRPIKIEGNPKHPASLGATDAIAQAAILELYDPDRSDTIYEIVDGKATARSDEELDSWIRSHFAAHKADGGAKLRILSEASSSPTLATQRARLLEAFPNLQWHEYEPLGRKDTAAERFDLKEADVVVCLDHDLFCDPSGGLNYARQFAEGRDPDGEKMKRLYVVESSMSITGAAADHRLALPSCEIELFASRLIQEVADLLDEDSGEHGLEQLLPENVSDFIRKLAEDLVAHRGRCLVTGGELHRHVFGREYLYRINRFLDGLGRTLLPISTLGESLPPAMPIAASIESLTVAMHAGAVDTLLIIGGNPIYSAPVDLDFSEALSKVATSIHLSPYLDETSRQCSWHIPQAHFLESWGDARAFDGTYSVVQPLIAPLFGGRSAIELLGVILGDQSSDGYSALRGQFSMIAKGNAPGVWNRTLHDGVLADSSSPPTDISTPERFPTEEVDALQEAGLELVFLGSRTVYDGRFANNGWLQEMPDPLTRLTWGGAAIFSPDTAKELGVEDQTFVELTLDGRTVKMPAVVMPGQADGSVAVQLGYGRTAAGQVGGSTADGVEPVGADAYKLRTSKAMHFATGLEVKPTGEKAQLASVQDHFTIEPLGKETRRKRAELMIRRDTLEHYREHPHFAEHAVHHPPLESLWQEHKWEGRQWGMTIDLSKCIGCGACVVACQAENNIPIVGKQQVLEGREMHWIRVDRYFHGENENTRAVVQPVACQHCELAPCEQVCPVAATVHDTEGLNVMVYNRCVGTRYCANNCPYKVRRFNYFNYQKRFDAIGGKVAKMVSNPEVTVRSRGVMEKCTYCLQRIKQATMEANRTGKPLEEGSLMTACQQVCPTRAIVFGDLSDQNSSVTKGAASDRAYAMLAELNNKPRTVYLARVENPNSKLEKHK